VLTKVIVGSSDEDVDAFKELWNDIPRVTKEIYAPTLNETINVSVNTRQYDLRLHDDIAKSLQWQTVITPGTLVTVGSKSTNRTFNRLHCTGE
jgi:hypothetical protein